MTFWGSGRQERQRAITLPGQAARRLTKLEFALLYTLMHHSGQMLLTDALIRQVWGDSYSADADILRKQVYRLRAKVGNQRIDTIKGIGYRFVATDE